MLTIVNIEPFAAQTIAYAKILPKKCLDGLTIKSKLTKIDGENSGGYLRLIKGRIHKIEITEEEGEINCISTFDEKESFRREPKYTYGTLEDAEKRILKIMESDLIL